MTAAHLACGAAKRGAHVHLVARRPLQTRSFDTDPGWLGPKHLRAFTEDRDPASRLARAKAARGGGTIPSWMRSRLGNAEAVGNLVVHLGQEVTKATIERGTCRLDLSEGESIETERVWLATGTTPDLSAMRCLEPLLPDIVTIDGYPLTNDDLRVGPHPVHVMGRLATLTLGPAAGNLWGAQRAARRITTAITGVDLELDLLRTAPQGCPSTRSHQPGEQR